MRIDRPLAVAAATTWLPPTRAHVDGRAGTDAGYAALTVSDTDTGPQLAGLAGRAALRAAGWSGADLDLLVHAWSYYQGHDFFSPAHQVAELLAARSALPIGIHTMCDGGAAAVRAAAAHLLADPAVRRSLVTTGDRFAAPGFRRWDGDVGVAYGDGGTAVALAVDHDAPLVLRALHSRASPEWEGMSRGDDPPAPAPRWWRSAVDVRGSKKAFLRRTGRERFAAVERSQLSAVVTGALEQAALDAHDPRLTLTVLPRLHPDVLEATYRPVLAGLTRAAPLDLGRDTGHLGAGDLCAGMAELVAAGLLGPGESALVLSVGLGFTWSCAVVSAP